ncbi:hypothetical protein GUJ93_ZPchr0010g9090 [Zizania palustris]|uniref:Uncharacterized protein n=1 Tax=Zizania palustris TaxID=103762 RepID=A0A8J6BNG8_ZIZPA|nr:hypothetical protein GUJ93_ZPchr0010g9090 [Zizania palustris]
MASASSQTSAQGISKGKEVVLPRLPSVQDFTNASSSEKVTEDKLTTGPSLEIQLAKFLPAGLCQGPYGPRQHRLCYEVRSFGAWELGAPGGVLDALFVTEEEGV